MMRYRVSIFSVLWLLWVDFLYFLFKKSLISLETDINFKVFAVFNWDVVFVLF